VNAVSPGSDSWLRSLGFSEEQLKEFVEQANNIPLGRVGTPDDRQKLSFSLPMTAALSTALSYSSMVAWHKIGKAQERVSSKRFHTDKNTPSIQGEPYALHYRWSRKFCKH